jgi:hypothetical protein
MLVDGSVDVTPPPVDFDVRGQRRSQAHAVRSIEDQVGRAEVGLGRSRPGTRRAGTE